MHKLFFILALSLAACGKIANTAPAAPASATAKAPSSRSAMPAGFTVVERSSDGYFIRLSSAERASSATIRACRGRYTNWVKPGVPDGVIYRREFCCTEYDIIRFPRVDIKSFGDYCPGASQLRKFFPQFFI